LAVGTNGPAEGSGPVRCISSGDAFRVREKVYTGKFEVVCLRGFTRRDDANALVAHTRDFQVLTTSDIINSDLANSHVTSRPGGGGWEVFIADTIGCHRLRHGQTIF
jgi:hypothetical protein